MPPTRSIIEQQCEDKIETLMKSLELKMDRNHQDITSKIDQQTNMIRDEFSKNLIDFQTKIENNVQRDLSNHSSRVEQLSAVVANIERETKLNDVILRGIPSTDNERVMNIFDQVCTTIGFELKCSAVNNVFRLGTTKNNTDRNTAILVKFSSLVLKREFMSKYFAFRNLNLRSIGMDSDERIYASDNLTKTNFDIQQKAVKLLKNKVIFKVHTRNGHVYVKFNEDGPFVLVQNSDDLQKAD